MSGHSILYLGGGEFAAEYLGELDTLALLYLPDSLVIDADVWREHCAV